MLDIKFGTDGWRGIIAQDYTFENLKIVSQAVADYLGAGKKIAVGYDTRFLSQEFAQASAEVFASNGISVVLSDRAIPTPAVSLAVRARKLDLGVMITASHNPPRITALKSRLPAEERPARKLPRRWRVIWENLRLSVFRELRIKL